MKPAVKTLALQFLALFVVFSCEAQCTSTAGACTQAVPHFVKFNGILRNASGARSNGAVAVKFIIYGESTGGTPLWEEVQNTRSISKGTTKCCLEQRAAKEFRWTCLSQASRVGWRYRRCYLDERRSQG